MDPLSSLPANNNTSNTPEENGVINKYFSDGTPSSSSINWMLMGAIVFTFLVLGNPWIDGLFCKIPYCGDNVYMSFGIKTVLFLVAIAILFYFMN